MIDYHKTTKGLITQIYGGQRASSKTRSHAPPTYSKKELRQWLFNQSLFHSLFYDWEESGYESLLKPSVDRIDDYKGYSIDNIQLMTWGKNKAKGHSDKKNGLNNKDNKAVMQFAKSGEFINEYYSASQASRETGIASIEISSVCRKTKESAGGFIWEFISLVTNIEPVKLMENMSNYNEFNKQFERKLDE